MSEKVDPGILASTHWYTFVKKILDAHGEDPDVTATCGEYYQLGFTDGFNYERAEGEEIDPIILASKEWYTKVKPELDAHGEDPVVTAKYGVHYRLAFIHGLKHREEAMLHY